MLSPMMLPPKKTDAEIKESVDLILNLFLARLDCYALQNDDGSYTTQYENMTAKLIRQHLAYEKSVLTYCLNKESKIKWAVTDFDSVSAKEEAEKVFQHISTLFSQATLLENTGGRGYHVWIFFSPPISAVVGRKIFEGILEKIKVKAEIYPKQTQLSPVVPLGNGVKLPLGLHKKYGKASVCISPSNLSLIKPLAVPKEIVDETLARCEHPEHYDSGDETAETVVGGKYRCPALTEVLKGTSAGSRDIAAFAIARFYRDLGLTKSEAEILMLIWNDANDPPMSEQQVKKCVDEGFPGSKRYGFGCSTFKNDPLKQYCDSQKENCKINKMIDRNLRLQRIAGV